jgi:hypothetical protein
VCGVTEGGTVLSVALRGTWELKSRVTRTSAGRVVPSPNGDDVVALLIYDGHGNFSAQFMQRDRQPEDAEGVSGASSGLNNSRPVNGYDAYFGRYTVDDQQGTVTQTLVGSLSPENVGQVLRRRMSVADDELTISVDTTVDQGEAAVITLRWRRVAE